MKRIYLSYFPSGCPVEENGEEEGEVGSGKKSENYEDEEEEEDEEVDTEELARPPMVYKQRSIRVR